MALFRPRFAGAAKLLGKCFIWAVRSASTPRTFKGYCHCRFLLKFDTIFLKATKHRQTKRRAKNRERSDELEQSTLGKRRFYPHRGKYERERRGSRRWAWNHQWAEGTGSRLRRGSTALRAARLGANVLGVDIARNLVEAGNSAQKSRAWPTASSRRAMPPICTS